VLLNDAKAQTPNKSQGAAVAPPETTGTSPDFEIRPGDSIVVKFSNAPLVVGSSVVGCVTYGQKLEVQAVQADWCWVKSLKCQGRIEGWINRRNVDKVSVSADEQPKMAKESQDAAVAAIKKLGGKVTFDEENPGKPVVDVDLSHSSTKATDLVHLKGLTSLQTLDLNGTKVTDAGLEHLKGLTNLHSLHLGKTKVTDTGLVHLKGMTSLHSLHLGKTKVADVGLVHLKGLTSLQLLNLGDTQVTDAGLVHLKGLTSLHTLSLSGSKVSEAGVKDLQAALPKCKITK
jgi:hypothetical protein